MTFKSDGDGGFALSILIVPFSFTCPLTAVGFVYSVAHPGWVFPTPRFPLAPLNASAEVRCLASSPADNGLGRSLDSAEKLPAATCTIGSGSASRAN